MALGSGSCKSQPLLCLGRTKSPLFPLNTNLSESADRGIFPRQFLGKRLTQGPGLALAQQQNPAETPEARADTGTTAPAPGWGCVRVPREG